MFKWFFEYRWIVVDVSLAMLCWGSGVSTFWTSEGLIFIFVAAVLGGRAVYHVQVQLAELLARGPSIDKPIVPLPPFEKPAHRINGKPVSANEFAEDWDKAA
jgi:hypothetical protein